MIEEALESSRTSLRLTREMGNRRVEAHALGSLGTGLLESGAFEESRLMFEQGLATLQSAPNRRLQGYLLGGLGELLFRQGRYAEAAAKLSEGEGLLRELGDGPMLARLLCTRGLVNVASSELGAASDALAEAETVAAAMSIVPNSDLRRKIERLRQALEQ